MDSPTMFVRVHGPRHRAMPRRDVRVNEAVHAGLLLAAALLCATAGTECPWRRGAVQTGVVIVVMAGLAVAGTPLPAVVLTGVLLVLVAIAVTRYAGELRRSSESDRRVREATERRSALLEAVQGLPELDLRSASRATTAALRAFGSDVSGIMLVRDGRLVPVDLHGVPPPERLQRIDEGLAGEAITSGRTVCIGDYQRYEDPLDEPGRDRVGAAIAAPIRVGEDVVGVVLWAADQPGAPSDAQVEIVEVLAAHLGAAITTRRQLDNQRLLLGRMDRLDAMRSAFAEEVSDELRDPLTIIRGAGHTLVTHGEELPTDDRRLLIERMCDTADELGHVVDALLDFSRFQAAHREPQVRNLDVGELLGPFADRVRVDQPESLAIEVAVDVVLVRHALELLVGDGRARIDVGVAATSVSLTLHLDVPVSYGIVTSLVAQLAAEAGAALRPDATPTLVLARAKHPVEAAP